MVFDKPNLAHARQRRSLIATELPSKEQQRVPTTFCYKSPFSHQKCIKNNASKKKKLFRLLLRLPCLFHQCNGFDARSVVVACVTDDGVIPLLHDASDEGAIAGYNAVHYPQIRRFKKSAPISVVFSDPQIMMIGQTYKELVDNNVDFNSADLDWLGRSRSRVMLMNKGLLRVYDERLDVNCY